MYLVRELRRFIRRSKSLLPMILLSLVISLVLNFYLLGKSGARQSRFLREERAVYDNDKSAFDKFENDVIDTQEDDYGSTGKQIMNGPHDDDELKSLHQPENSDDVSLNSRSCLRTLLQPPKRARNMQTNFTDSPEFHEVINITSYVPLHPLTKIVKFLQTGSEIKIKMYCDGIRKFEKRNNVSVEHLPQNFRYRLSLKVLHNMDYELKLPGAIIIGFKKGGTTALKFFLNFHPQLNVVRKELDFFRDTRKYQAGLDFYRSKFDFAESNQINMEKSSNYVTSKQVPQRITESLGSGVKLILCVRNPVNRTISDFHHTSFLHFKKEDRKFQTSESEGDRFVRSLFDEKGRLKSDNQFIIPSLYSVHLKNWLKYFSMDQVLIVQEEEFRRDLPKVLRGIESFLQIEQFFQPSMFKYGRRTCFVHNGAENCSPRWGSEIPKPKINDTVKQTLRDFFRPFNRDFEKVVGQRFPWTNW